ncbi:MAG: response regulator [Clostridiales bacterium]|nr:response regulator [Clostridiales bacterium]
MKLLIVDDEDIIREGLVNGIAWEENGFDLTVPGKNGREAMEIIERDKPDIVLADINMPFMDGLELAQWIRENHPDISVIFLTGYDEFQYAKKAIELKAAAYILKYEKREVLLQEIKNVAAQIKKTRTGQMLHSRGKTQLISQTINNLIIGSAKMNSEKTVLERLEFPGGDWSFCLALIDVSLDTPVDEEKPNENGLYLFSYINVVKEVCGYYPVKAHCGSYDNQIYVLFAKNTVLPKDLLTEAQMITGEICQKLKQFLRADAKAGISRPYQDIFQTDMAYNSSYITLQSIKNQKKDDVVLARRQESSLANTNIIMREISDFIDANYTRAGLNLNDLAESIHLSPSHLCRLIKKYENTNFMTWLTNVRIQKAASLIRNTDLKIYEICDQVGYNNPQYFSVVFKKYMGCSPREYK